MVVAALLLFVTVFTNLGSRLGVCWTCKGILNTVSSFCPVADVAAVDFFVAIEVVGAFIGALVDVNVVLVVGMRFTTVGRFAFSGPDFCDWVSDGFATVWVSVLLPFSFSAFFHRGMSIKFFFRVTNGLKIWEKSETVVNDDSNSIFSHSIITFS